MSFRGRGLAHRLAVVVVGLVAATAPTGARPSDAERALGLLRAGRVEDAIAAYGCALHEDADDYDARMGLAFALHAAGDPTARAAYLDALAIDLAHSRGHREAWWTTGVGDHDPRQRRRELSDRIAEDPADAFSVFLRGNRSWREGRRGSAARDWRRSVEADPRWAPARVNLALAATDPRERIDHLTRALQELDGPLLWYERGLAHSKLGLWMAAADDIARAAAKEPCGRISCPEVRARHARRAVAWAWLGQWERALEDSTHALRTVEDSGAHLAHAALLRAMGRTEEAVTALVAVLRSGPSRWEEQQALRALTRLGRLMPCDGCKGTGGAHCAPCGGEGWRRCLPCDDTGRRDGSYWQLPRSCPACLDERSCRPCSGRGRLACLACGGSGSRIR